MSRSLLLLVLLFATVACPYTAIADEQQLQFDDGRLLITAIATMGAPAHGDDVSVGQPIEFNGTGTAKFKNQDTQGHVWTVGFEMNIARQAFRLTTGTSLM